MNKYAVFVMGPAGTGKTTFCKTMLEKFVLSKKNVGFVNLDPAAVQTRKSLKTTFDIRDKWSLESVMRDKMLGPNGGLIKCLELMIDERTWLEDNLCGYGEEFMFVDCPGQIEVYLHSNAMQDIINVFKENNYNVCVAFLLDSQFLLDKSKYLAGILNTLSAMLQLELPHVNIVTKMDLFPNYENEDEETKYESIQNLLYPDMDLFAQEGGELEKAFVELVDTYNLVNYLPLDITDEKSISLVINYLNNVLQNDDIDLNMTDYEFNKDI